MKYLTTTLAIAFMAFGFASITTIPAHANGGCYDEYSCSRPVGDSSPEHMQRGAQIDKILAPGGTAVESDHQFAESDCKDDPYQRHCLSFADREGGSGGDFGESGGGDFGEGDRAAASTAAE